MRAQCPDGTQVSHCSLLFLDEPTSGLDASSSTEVATVLSRLAMLGITVVMVLHQVVRARAAGVSRSRV